jgi:hypothetical protein
MAMSRDPPHDIMAAHFSFVHLQQDKLLTGIERWLSFNSAHPALNTTPIIGVLKLSLAVISS